MIEQDYLLRLIKEYISVMMKLLFGAELKSAEELPEYQEKYGGDPNLLFRLADEGRIREAEELLYAGMDQTTAANLLKAYSFYQYICQKDDDFLEAHQYSREQIEAGLRRLAATFHAEHLIGLFWPE